ncbi:MAG: hypothetical protein ACRDH9_01975 [Actinomycetota bacterium]
MSSLDRPPALRTFAQDLRHAMKAWRSHPRLPIYSVLIEGGPYIFTAITYWLIDFPDCNRHRGHGCGPLFIIEPWATLIFTLVFAGWYGTQRIWYLRAFRGRQLEPGEFWPLTSAFRRRYIVLGLLFVAVGMVPVLGLLISPGNTRAAIVALVIWTMALDAAITFVTPALAFSTRKVRDAFRIGFKLIKQTWPASLLYVFIPPLALRAAAAAASASTQRSAVVFAIVADVFFVLLLAWFKGATARFYLRFNETGDNGAAFPETAEGSEDDTRAAESN